MTATDLDALLSDEKFIAKLTDRVQERMHETVKRLIEAHLRENPPQGVIVKRDPDHAIDINGGIAPITDWRISLKGSTSNTFAITALLTVPSGAERRVVWVDDPWLPPG